MADEKKPADEDKSINELLDEYAGDVKDKDLDDFLKHGDEEEDVFEGEETDDEDSDKELVDEVQPKKSGGGFMSMLLIILAFGAAGAGAYVYLNKDQGMTAIMGGFMGQDEPEQTAALDTPPTPDAAPVMLPAPTDETPQPMPIVNDPFPPAAEITPVPEPGADLLAMPTSETGAPAGEPVAAPAADLGTPPSDAETAATAVDKWMAGGDSGMLNEMGVAETLPEKTIEEVKAKPPTTAKKTAEKKVEKTVAKKERVKEPANDADVAAAEIAASKEVPAKDVEVLDTPKAVSAPKASKSAAVSPQDDALPPPYVAIQAKKGGAASEPATTTTRLSVDTTGEKPAIEKPAPASNSKMTPIIEGGAAAPVQHSSSGTGRDVEGNTNKNLADVTSATGETAAMVAKGGGMIELPSQGVPAPVGMMPTRTAPQPAPELRTYKLAIQGGKSLPPGTQTSVYAQIPDTTTGTKPATMAQPTPPAVPVARVEASQPADEPATISPRPQAAPSASESSAPAILRAAQDAEAAGRSGDALELYQRALEVDAVQAGGTSIDRGAVYDRIGAIRAGQ